MKLLMNVYARTNVIYGLFILVTVVLLLPVIAKKKEGKENEKWKKKHITDYTDADLERLYEQWEDDDEPLEEDELPEWKRPQEKIDLSKIDPNDPESVLKMTKKGRTLMMFATVSGNPSEKETQDISQIWHTSLFNNNIETQRYVVGGNRVLFVLKDGSKAWEIKDYLVLQDRCDVVTIEGKDYYGKGHTGGMEADEKPVEDRKEKKSSKEEKKPPKKSDSKKSKDKSKVPEKKVEL